MKEEFKEIAREAIYSLTDIGYRGRTDSETRAMLVEDGLSPDQIERFLEVEVESKALTAKARDLAFDAAMLLLEGSLKTDNVAREFGMIKDPMNGYPGEMPDELRKLLGSIVKREDPLLRILAHNVGALEEMMLRGMGYVLHLSRDECKDCDVMRCPVMKILRQPKGVRIPVE